MTLSARTLRSTAVLAGIIVFGAGLSTGLTGCRTAQEARHGLPASRTQPGSQLAHQLDSMGMIEQKLVEVIDSLSMLAETDRDRIRALEADVAMLRSRIDGTELPEPPSAERRSAEGRSAAPQQPPERSYTAPPPAPPPAPQPQAPPPSSESSGALERYQSALRLYNAKEYSEALAAFTALENDDPHGLYAGNYKYWEGECYYALKQYDKALRRFQNVLDEFTRSSKAPASEFKIAECYERLGLLASARSAYERLLTDYPNSEFRAKANARISALSGSGGSNH